MTFVQGPQGLLGQIPRHLSLDKGLTEAIQFLLKNLAGRGEIETKVFDCRGANNQLEEVTVLASVGKNYLRIRCPRLQTELRYIMHGYDKPLKHDGSFCYGGEDLQNIPVVGEEEFASHKILKCPYDQP